jgi:hypothetical protein
MSNFFPENIARKCYACSSCQNFTPKQNQETICLICDHYEQQHEQVSCMLCIICSLKKISKFIEFIFLKKIVCGVET